MGIEEQLPEDFEGRDKLARFSNLEALAKSYRELEQKQGGMVSLPKAEEDFTALMRKLGAPDSAEGYQVDAPIPGLKETAAQIGLTPAQLEAIVGTTKTAEQQRAEANQAAIQEAFGPRMDEANTNVARAKKALGEDVDTSDPAVFKALEKLGALMSDHQVPQGSAPTPQGPSPQDIAEQLRSVMQTEAFSSKRHPEHEKAQILGNKLRQELAKFGIYSVHDERLTANSALPSIRRGAKPAQTLFDQIRDN